MPVREASTFNFENYDKIVVAALDGSQAFNTELLNLGAPQHKVVTFFSTRNWGRRE